MAPKSDPIARGETDRKPLGTALFVGLRLLDPFLQRYLLTYSPTKLVANKIGLTTMPPPVGDLPLSLAGLGPYQSLIWAFSVAAAAKHVFWILVTCKEPIYPSFAVGVAAFNTVFNSINSVAFTLASNNPTWSPWNVFAGAALLVLGILIETGGEVQRKIFKDDPKNEGKICDIGLWSIVRHVSYSGYTLWRAGYALASGGPFFGAVTASFFIYNFITSSIPSLDCYMSSRYGQQWTRTKQRVPYALIPGIW